MEKKTEWVMTESPWKESLFVDGRDTGMYVWHPGNGPCEAHDLDGNALKTGNTTMAREWLEGKVK